MPRRFIIRLPKVLFVVIIASHVRRRPSSPSTTAIATTIAILVGTIVYIPTTPLALAVAPPVVVVIIAVSRGGGRSHGLGSEAFEHLGRRTFGSRHSLLDDGHLFRGDGRGSARGRSLGWGRQRLHLVSWSLSSKGCVYSE
jgi:hypothetical protein